MDCEICYKIICKNCGWVASDEEATLVQNGQIKACSVCGWSPKSPILASE